MVSKKLLMDAVVAKEARARRKMRRKGGWGELDVVDSDADGLQKVVNDSL
jgi:hypothetical protein